VRDVLDLVEAPVAVQEICRSLRISEIVSRGACCRWVMPGFVCSCSFRSYVVVCLKRGPGSVMIKYENVNFSVAGGTFSSYPLIGPAYTCL
jgi:hypothetical protein